MIRRLAGLSLVVIAAISGGAAVTTALPGRAVAADTFRPVTIHMLRTATVRITARDEASQPWRSVCTGTKVRLGMADFVLTAAHCIGKGRELGVQPPHSPVASVLARAVLSGSDTALLKVAPVGSFADMPAVDYLAASRRSSDGERTDSYSYEISAKHGAETPGRYLGRERRPDRRTQELDFLALAAADTPTPATDACYFGGSGSLAVIGPGRLTGPLSVRIRTTLYAGHLHPEPGDLSLRDAHTYVAALDVPVSTADATLCGYAVPSSSSLLRAASSLS